MLANKWKNFLKIVIPIKRIRIFKKSDNVNTVHIVFHKVSPSKHVIMICVIYVVIK
jgi:hypothetical protein